MNFDNEEDLFIKFCVLNTIKFKLTETHKKQVMKEIKEIKDFVKKK